MEARPRGSPSVRLRLRPQPGRRSSAPGHLLVGVPPDGEPPDTCLNRAQRRRVSVAPASAMVPHSQRTVRLQSDYSQTTARPPATPRAAPVTRDTRSGASARSRKCPGRTRRSRERLTHGPITGRSSPNLSSDQGSIRPGNRRRIDPVRVRQGPEMKTWAKQT